MSYKLPVLLPLIQTYVDFRIQYSISLFDYYLIWMCSEGFDKTLKSEFYHNPSGGSRVGIFGQTDGRTDGRTDGHTDRQADRETDRQT
jgi:hypothetical protein